ncbi:aldehyde dehydrogenase [Pseudomonas sp. GX19020]|uniref:aldehyde dehydrogenase n=1 Tax=Pseudomonas sp. GX19020 TaxID=2942277 RepID=UPI0020185952|nr:aldehyde dehydrogenase [Pseudomonas sp. GX19020]MCL4067018.1 aldehyde dehydrogenase [Pseudomonas sp. GX19020]
MRIDRNFVNNDFLTSDGEELIAVLNPATGQQIAHVTAATAAEARAGVEAAAHAQRGWRRLTSVERAGHLRALADMLVARKDRIGAVLALESGKSLEDATGEVFYAAELTRYHAEWARRIEGEIIPSDSPDENLLLQREPIGVVAALIPFNYPIYTLMRKIAPALIAGNTVVARPSNNTPSSALEVARAVKDCGFPAGAINIIAMTHQVAQTVCTHPRVGMITLTGSVGAGRKVLEYSQVNIAKSSLELGGKTPAIIEADADLEKAAAAVVASRTTHCGQLCTAIERVYVQDSVHDQFVDLLRSHMAARKFGDRMREPSVMGPLINQNSRVNIHQMVSRAIDDGAQLECGGFIPDGPGWFYPPTLLTNCRQEMEIVQEEVFGPVLPVLRYQTTEDALAMANDHQFGLSSVIYTENYRKAMMVANNIEAGEVYINRTPADPYQGYHSGWKRSGLGGDDGKHGMLDFTQTRLVIQSW